jgi:hypothetical protein
MLSQQPKNLPPTRYQDFSAQYAMLNRYHHFRGSGAAPNDRYAKNRKPKGDLAAGKIDKTPILML